VVPRYKPSRKQCGEERVDCLRAGPGEREGDVFVAAALRAAEGCRSLVWSDAARFRGQRSSCFHCIGFVLGVKPHALGFDSYSSFVSCRLHIKKASTIMTLLQNVVHWFLVAAPGH
jgi:hypothetical protein